MKPILDFYKFWVRIKRNPRVTGGAEVIGCGQG